MSLAIGQVIRGILKVRSLDTLVLVGGDTALGVLNELGISSLKLIYEALPGVAAAEAVLWDGRVQTIITKSGSYGDDDIFCRLLEGVNNENPYGLEPEVAWNMGISFAREFVFGMQDGLFRIAVFLQHIGHFLDLLEMLLENGVDDIRGQAENSFGFCKNFLV